MVVCLLAPGEADIVAPVGAIILLLEMSNPHLALGAVSRQDHDAPFEPTVSIGRMEKVQLAPLQRRSRLDCRT